MIFFPINGKVKTGVKFFPIDFSYIITMKKYLIGLLFLNTAFLVLAGQPDPILNKCISNSGSGVKYLKDYRVQLGEGKSQSEFRFKANLSLRKNTRYRFTMCTDNKSKGQLIFMLMNSENKIILSSLDKKTGIRNPNVDLTCRKSGIYHICFDFTLSQSGSGTGIVSMIQ
jgi:hypothetical protein